VNERVVAVSRRFARVATRAVVARPTLWRLFRGPLRAQFDALAETWEARRTEASVAPVTAALERLPADPARILDLGTGTGIAARAAAARYPGARVVGVDLSPRMIKEARRLAPTELGERVRFEVADASALPFAPAEFDLVLLLNMIPFFSELARVTAAGGHAVIGFSSGVDTPIYVPTPTLERELSRVGFDIADEVTAGSGTAVVARRL
jgi:ubiquinone/menaquinone biosynthesis C-methylase UbiE